MAFFGLFLPVLGERTRNLQPDLIEVENAPKMNPQYINISAYKFVPIKDPVAVKADLLPKCKSAPGNRRISAIRRNFLSGFSRFAGQGKS